MPAPLASGRAGAWRSCGRPRMAVYKSKGIVLRSIRYGEADRILDLYTREGGLISAIAKGIRRTKSRFGARLEPAAGMVGSVRALSGGDEGDRRVFNLLYNALDTLEESDSAFESVEAAL